MSPLPSLTLNSSHTLTFGSEGNFLVASCIPPSELSSASQAIGGAAEEDAQIVGVDRKDRQRRFPRRRTQSTRRLGVGEEEEVLGGRKEKGEEEVLGGWNEKGEEEVLEGWKEKGVEGADEVDKKRRIKDFKNHRIYICK